MIMLQKPSFKEKNNMQPMYDNNVSPWSLNGR